MIEKLLEIQAIILEQFKQQVFYSRIVFESMKVNNRITGIVGSRGVGKTTFLLNQVLQKGPQHALYVSADNFYFLDNQLLSLVDYLYKETDIRLLCIDEIHKYANWNQELKNIYDTYLDFKILFSGSSAIDIRHSKYDLSRRVTLHELHGFSFREYLQFLYNKNISQFSFDEIIRNHQQITQDILTTGILKYFREYLRSGYYPFFNTLSNEYEKFQAIENIVSKIIYEDIATLHSLKTSSLGIIEKLFKYVLQTLPGEFSIYKLSKTLNKDFESLSQYINFLEQAGLIRCLYPNKTGHAFIRNPIKVYPENTNLMYSSFIPQSLEVITGKGRETFIMNQIQNSGHQVYYSEIGDFCVDNHILEIGGKGKTTQQIKNQKNAVVVADGILQGSPHTIPLYLFGFLY